MPYKCKSHYERIKPASNWNDSYRGSAASRGYDSTWNRARKVFLKLHPLCEGCKAVGTIQAAKVVDHIKPHKGNSTLFWDAHNWQSLCEHCHAKKSATEHIGK